MRAEAVARRARIEMTEEVEKCILVDCWVCVLGMMIGDFSWLRLSMMKMYCWK